MEVIGIIVITILIACIVAGPALISFYLALRRFEEDIGGAVGICRKSRASRTRPSMRLVTGRTGGERLSPKSERSSSGHITLVK